MVSNRQNFQSFWTIFCPFTPLTASKIINFKKFKKCLKILSFYKRGIMKIIYGSWDIEHNRDNFLLSWPIFPLLPPSPNPAPK